MSRFNPSLAVDKRRNLWRYTEDISQAAYSVNSGTKDATKTMNFKGITLGQFTSANFYGELRSPLLGLSLPLLTAGKRYFVSCYVINLRAGEQMVWTRYMANASANGHGPKLIDGRVRRIWTLRQATDAYSFDRMENPTVAMGSGATAEAPYWVFQGNSIAGGAGDIDLRIGGFQLELAPDGYKDGVALIGDSTMAGSSGKVDLTGSREASTYAAALLNVPFFNRAVGGDTTTTMLGRWATDITPLAVNSKYAIIQGGINDLGAGTALATIESNIQSMYNNAVTDGMIPIVATCTPLSTTYAAAAAETDRRSLNAWIKATFPLVMDFNAVIEDPGNLGYIRPAFVPGDGSPHYIDAGKRALGNAMAMWPLWDFLKPSPYQPVKALSPKLRTPAELQAPPAWELPHPIGLDVWKSDVSLSGRATLVSV